MIDYIYDGTFDGMLTCIYHHYYTEKAAGIFTEERYQPSFLQGSFTVTTEPAKADRVYRAIRSKISEYDLKGVYRAWLSCDPEKEMKILRYVCLGFREGPAPDLSCTDGNPMVCAAVHPEKDQPGVGAHAAVRTLFGSGGRRDVCGSGAGQ